METIYLKFLDLDYILAHAEMKLEEDIKAYDLNCDKIELAKVMAIREELLKTPSEDFILCEAPF